ncbi:MAG: nuclear transport factor 2 family protein [Candidatus Omnitrophica bacterium]|nr:nuclear transport factor 2 family protein [Candidatus Omnitrophota bacterium]
MKRSVFLVFVFCLILIMPAFSSEQADTAKEEIKATICELMNRVTSTAETLDAAKTLSVLSDDPDAVFFFGSKPYSKAELVRTLAEAYGKLKSMKISMNAPKVEVLGADAAVWTATGRADSVGKSGESYTEMLTETWIWQKQSGIWRVVHYNESVTVPPLTPKNSDK